MKVAVIALAATAVVFAQPSFAQNVDRDQSNSTDSWQGGPRNSDRDAWRGQNPDERQDWRRMHRRGMGEDGDGRWWRMHERMVNANEGAAHFRFRRGSAVVDVRCSQGDSLQACVNAAGQLIDKVAKLHDDTKAPTTAPSTSSPMTLQPANPNSTQVPAPSGSNPSPSDR
jgi:Tfp pilus assembly protein FimT